MSPLAWVAELPRWILLSPGVVAGFVFLLVLVWSVVRPRRRVVADPLEATEASAMALWNSLPADDDLRRRLEAIDWESFDAADRRQSEVPKLIVALQAEETTAIQAVDGLSRLLCTGGESLYSAASPATPFLIEALGRTGGAVQARIVSLLQDFGWCTNVVHVGERLPQWGFVLRDRLVEEIGQFRALAGSADERVAAPARELIKDLESSPQTPP